MKGVPDYKLKVIQPFPEGHILDSSKLKEFADDNSKCDENGRVIQKDREKEKLVVMRNYCFSHIVFKRLVLQRHKKQEHVWERIKL